MLFDWQGAWASVIHHPLFGIGITLGAYQLVLAAFEKTRWIFLQPVLVSMLLVIGVLVGCGTASGPFPPIDAMQMAARINAVGRLDAIRGDLAAAAGL